LPRRASDRFDTIVTAERAGFYKPHPQPPYRFALAELAWLPRIACSSRVRPMICSAPRRSDCRSTARPDRHGAPAGTPPSLARGATLLPLRALVLGRSA